jgi:hypothetical protein
VLQFDGTALVTGAPAPAATWRRADDLPAALARLCDAWATARGLVRREQADDAVLVVTSVRGGTEHAVHAARDGWSLDARASGPVPPRDEFGPLEPWLATADGEVVVARATGRVHVSLLAIDDPRGDPAAWAVSWSELLDASLALPRGSVSIAERRAAGSPLVRDPSFSGASESDAVGPWAAFAAAAAALLALAAAWLALAPARGGARAVP